MRVPPSAPEFACWLAREQHGLLPRAGGWLDQPLALLNAMTAITLTVETKRYLARPAADWTQLSRLQLDLIRWLEAVDG